jgi:methionine-S-sulfoxide reductase
MSRFRTVAAIAAGLLAIGYAGSRLMSEPVSNNSAQPPAAAPTRSPNDPSKFETATFGNGCFWCTEAVFEQLRGVRSVVSGYSGGSKPNPTYEEVSTGATGHAEVIQIEYDPAAISFADLLKVFWQTHDPTTLNRQGHDVGTQYRSAVFYHSEEQRQTAEQYKQQLDKSGTFKSPIVTEIIKFEKFYPAEKYHQEYFQLNPNQGYCVAVIRPKVEKFRKEFKPLLAK